MLLSSYVPLLIFCLVLLYTARQILNFQLWLWIFLFILLIFNFLFNFSMGLLNRPFLQWFLIVPFGITWSCCQSWHSSFHTSACSLDSSSNSVDYSFQNKSRISLYQTMSTVAISIYVIILFRLNYCKSLQDYSFVSILAPF